MKYRRIFPHWLPGRFAGPARLCVFAHCSDHDEGDPCEFEKPVHFHARDLVFEKDIDVME